MPLLERRNSPPRLTGGLLRWVQESGFMCTANVLHYKAGALLETSESRGNYLCEGVVKVSGGFNMTEDPLVVLVCTNVFTVHLERSATIDPSCNACESIIVE